MSDHTCPRCGHQIPNDQTPGAYPGALSRVDNETEICSACGLHEAMQQFRAQSAAAATPKDQWPIDIPTDMYARS